MKTQSNFAVATFGELMLRLTPYHTLERLVQTEALRMSFAGAESNVAISLSYWGYPCFFISHLPSHQLGDAAFAYLHRWGIHTPHVYRSGTRIGTYYIEHGSSIRPTQVVYDRANSAFSQVEPHFYDWETILNGKSLFFLTGITPALSHHCQQSCLDALRVAKQLGLTVAFDLNFRRTLWTRTDARNAFVEIFPYVDILFANLGAAIDVFDFHSDAKSSDPWNTINLQTQEAGEFLASKGSFEMIVMSVRQVFSAHQHRLGGMVYNQESWSIADPLDVELIDRLGGGDAFAAAVLHGWINQWPTQKLISFATSAFALQQTLPGDLNLHHESEIWEVASGATYGLKR